MNIREAMDALDRINLLLEQMYALAERSAGDGCTDADREALQRGVEVLLEQIDREADALAREGIFLFPSRGHGDKGAAPTGELKRDLGRELRPGQQGGDSRPL